MRKFKSRYPTDEELLARLEHMGHELRIARAVLHRRMYWRKRQQQAIAGFPFDLLERAVRSGLSLVERMVARIVRAVVR